MTRVRASDILENGSPAGEGGRRTPIRAKPTDQPESQARRFRRRGRPRHRLVTNNDPRAVGQGHRDRRGPARCPGGGDGCQIAAGDEEEFSAQAGAEPRRGLDDPRVGFRPHLFDRAIIPPDQPLSRVAGELNSRHLRVSGRRLVMEEPHADVMQVLYDEHAAPLLRCAMRLTGDHARAEDVVQETLFRAWQHPEVTDDSQRSARPWLFRVARNMIIDDTDSSCRFPTKVADRDPSTCDFAEFSSKWRTRFLIFVADPRTIRSCRKKPRDASGDETGALSNRLLPTEPICCPDDRTGPLRKIGEDSDSAPALRFSSLASRRGMPARW